MFDMGRYQAAQLLSWRKYNSLLQKFRQVFHCSFSDKVFSAQVIRRSVVGGDRWMQEVPPSLSNQRKEKLRMFFSGFLRLLVQLNI